jgi:citrate lyase subunit beta / citryl-CoA lyase
VLGSTHDDETAARIAAGRSFLFVPGDRPERFEKACAAGADAVIVDLEDAVAAQRKPEARAGVAAWLDAAPASAVLLLRINAQDTPWFEADLALAAHPRWAGVVLPKAEDAATIASLGEQLPRCALLPLIETAQGVWNAISLARSPGVVRLMFGAIDLMLDLAVQADDEALQPFRSQLVLVSRVARLAAPVEGVTREFRDLDAVAAQARRARRQGFGAKLCIHPGQVAAVNECFSPSGDELEWARRVLAAAHASGGAAVSLDGAMVDRPVIEQAKRLLAIGIHAGGAASSSFP